jgi:hypothetical protein
MLSTTATHNERQAVLIYLSACLPAYFVGMERRARELKEKEQQRELQHAELRVDALLKRITR